LPVARPNVALDDCSMITTLHGAERADARTIENLFQFYCYDFTEMLGINVGPDGTFPVPQLEPYFQDGSAHHAWVVRVDGHLAGFAMIRRQSRITLDPHTWDVAEFFVMKQYRRKGAGASAAIQIFEAFRGRWEVRQIHANVAATHFWRATLERYTEARYTETVVDDGRWRGPVQTFDNTTPR
jgi:predicted acetyltransferase